MTACATGLPYEGDASSAEPAAAGRPRLPQSGEVSLGRLLLGGWSPTHGPEGIGMAGTRCGTAGGPSRAYTACFEWVGSRVSVTPCARPGRRG